MARLQALVVRRQDQRRRALKQRLAFALGIREMTEQPLGVGGLEVERRVLALRLQEHVPVLCFAVEAQVEHVVDPCTYMAKRSSP